MTAYAEIDIPLDEEYKSGQNGNDLDQKLITLGYPVWVNPSVRQYA